SGWRRRYRMMDRAPAGERRWPRLHPPPGSQMLTTRQVRSLAEAFACTVVPILTGLCSEGRSALITIVTAGTANRCSGWIHLIAAVPVGQTPKPGRGDPCTVPLSLPDR